MNINLNNKIIKLANEIKVENDLYLFDFGLSIEETANAIWHQLEIMHRIEIVELADPIYRKLAKSDCIELISNVLTSENSNA